MMPLRACRAWRTLLRTMWRRTWTELYGPPPKLRSTDLLRQPIAGAWTSKEGRQDR